MKFMIRCDIEGVTGVTTYEQADNSDFGKAMLANDLNAVIEGLGTGHTWRWAKMSFRPGFFGRLSSRAMLLVDLLRQNPIL